MQNSPQKLSFHGSGQKLFSLQIVNLLLIIVTLGIYYPWARAAVLKYTFSETDFAGSRFTFHGNGFELLKGMILGILILGGAYGLFFYLSTVHHPFIGGFLFFFFMMLFIPFIIHSSMRYRTSRTTWRGIHFGYRGDLKEIMNISAKGTLLSIATLGIYGAWFAMELRRYVLGNVRMGNVEFSYTGVGSTFFWMNFKGYFLTIITFGIYAFWWMKDMYNYYVNNIVLKQNGNVVNLKSTVSGGGFFKLMAVNLLIIVFTLGLGSPWATVRTLNFIFNHVEFLGELDLDGIIQTEEDYKNAMGEDLAGIFDVGIV
ncbi:MAG: DUF898 family protein [Opitutaceae bacterium]|nr:DUF898 family protein [Cytophagales bacterium]